MEKALRNQKNMSSWFIAPMEKAWFDKDCLKKYSIKDTIPIKTSFKNYIKKSTRVMLPVVFEEFEVAYIFFAIFFSFYDHCQFT